MSIIIAQNILSQFRNVYVTHNLKLLTALKNPCKLQLVISSLILSGTYKAVLELGVCMHAYIITIFTQSILFVYTSCVTPFPLTLNLSLSPKVTV